MAAQYRIRRARRADGPAFVQLVVDMAAFEKLTPPDPAARRRLVRDAFGTRPKYELHVATQGTAVVGYLMVLWTYSSFLAKPTLWIEDIYVAPPHQGKGLAHEMLRFLARRALKQRAGRIEGVVLTWNQRARRFYAKTGAKELDGWLPFRYEEGTLRRLAKPF